MSVPVVVSAVVANSTIPLLDVDASSPDISPLLISIPSPAENLPLTSDVLNCVLVSVEAIVTAPPDSVIVTFEPAVNAKVSEPPNVFPPAVTVLNVFVFVSVDEIVTVPPLSEIDTLLPALNANVSPLANVFPPAVIVLGAVNKNQ